MAQGNSSILKGTIYVTDDINIILNVPDNTVRIISLDEDNQINPNDPNVIVGTCLLPPTECLIAEADGDEDLYNINYMNYMNSPYIQEFVGALISALYKGTSLILFAPQMKQNLSITKLREMFWGFFGIGIGIANSEICNYDPRCIPIWLNMIYSANVISAQEFLIQYPEDVPINNLVLYKLFDELKPVGDTQQIRIDSIKRYHHRIKNNHAAQPAVFDLR